MMTENNLNNLYYVFNALLLANFIICFVKYTRTFACVLEAKIKKLNDELSFYKNYRKSEQEYFRYRQKIEDSELSKIRSEHTQYVSDIDDIIDTLKSEDELDEQYSEYNITTLKARAAELNIPNIHKFKSSNKDCLKDFIVLTEQLNSILCILHNSPANYFENDSEEDEDNSEEDEDNSEEDEDNSEEDDDNKENRFTLP